MEFSDCSPGVALWLCTQGLEPAGLDALLRDWPQVRRVTMADDLPEGARGIALVDAGHPPPPGFRSVRTEAEGPWVLAALERILKGILAPGTPQPPPPLPTVEATAEEAGSESAPPLPGRGQWKTAARARGRLKRGRRPVKKR